jgi:hypothetical protein
MHHAQAPNAIGARTHMMRTKQAMRAAMSSGAMQYPRTQRPWKNDLDPSQVWIWPWGQKMNVHSAAEKLGLDRYDERADGDNDYYACEYCKRVRGRGLGWSFGQSRYSRSAVKESDVRSH